MLFHVYKEDVPEGHYLNEPTGIYRTLLDADWLLWILLPLLLLIIVGIMMYAWHLHEIPSHKAQTKKMRQAELVSALTLLGLFQHWVWAIALFIAYMDWDAVEDFLVGVLRKANAPGPLPPDVADGSSFVEPLVPTPSLTIVQVEPPGPEPAKPAGNPL